ncbi:MAG: hypothetical protein WCS52_09515 [bacterium]
MKRLIMALIVGGAGVSSFAGQDDTNSTDQAILRELSAIHASLDKIASELSAMRNQKALPPESSFSSDDDSGFVLKKANVDTLRGITLPANPTEAQIGQYISEIVKASKGQNTFGDSDIQVGMLARVGSTNLQYLVDALNGSQGCGNYHLEAAICRLADNQNKELILKTLPVQHNLVKVVTRMGWEPDARGTLLAELKNKTDYLPTEWISAVASLRDPASYPLLRDYFIYGHNKYWTYSEIKDLPIDNMPAAIVEAWQRSRAQDPVNKRYMAMVAMQFGHKDALECVCDGLVDPASRNYGNNGEMRSSVLKMVDFYGTNEELANWYRTNRDKIKFNAATKKFIVEK